MSKATPSDTNLRSNLLTIVITITVITVFFICFSIGALMIGVGKNKQENVLLTEAANLNLTSIAIQQTIDAPTSTSTSTISPSETATVTATEFLLLSDTPTSTQDKEPPLPPGELNGKLNICAGTEKIYVKFNWQPVGDAGSQITYEWVLYRAHMGKEDYTQRATGKTTDTNVQLLVECGYEYKVKVRAIDSAGNSSEYSTATIKLQRPVVVASVTPGAPGGGGGGSG